VGHEGWVISHFHYADETLFIGEVTVENLWTMKGLLRGFEFMSGLNGQFLQKLLNWCKCAKEVYGDGMWFF